MGAVADQQPLADRHSRLLHPLHFLEEGLRIHDDAVADDRDLVRPNNARGQQLQDELLPVHHHRVAGVGAALIARHDVEVLGEGVDDFALCLHLPTALRPRRCY